MLSIAMPLNIGTSKTVFWLTIVEILSALLERFMPIEYIE